MLPQVRELERRFGRDVVFVVVHSGKFPAEREPARLAHAMRRLGVAHPVANDRQFRAWRAWAVRGWPSFAVVDARGYVRAQWAGERPAADVAPLLAALVAEAEGEGTLDRAPRWLDDAHDAARAGLVADAAAPRPLRFPGALALGAPTPDGRRPCAVADTGHHRLLLGHLDAAGTRLEVVHRVGRGVATGDLHGAMPAGATRDDLAARADGTPDEAAFDGPRGLAFGTAGDGRPVLWVADAGHHALRAVDLAADGVTPLAVRTVAGTGARRATAADRAAGALASPWDVAVLARPGGRTLVAVAMAGTHQLWILDPATGAMRAAAGGRGEDVRDGPPAEALFAQPMALAAHGDTVWSADAESSAVRALALAGAGQVSTLVGTGLFDFGDRDGAGDDARLQHPEGLARLGDGRLAVADSYNDALKWLDPATRLVTTAVRGLHEPQGLAAAGDTVWVADAGAHRLLRVRADGDVAEVTVVT